MRFKMPETLDGLNSAQISELLDAATAEANEINTSGDELTADQRRDLIELVGHIDTLEPAKEAAEADDAALEGARSRLKAGKPAEDKAPEGDDDKGGNADKVDADADKTDADADKVDADSIVAGGTPAGRTQPRGFSGKSKAGDKIEISDSELDLLDEKAKALSITAAANVPGFASEQKIESYSDLAKAYAGRARAFAAGTRSGRRGSKGLDLSYTKGSKLSSTAQRFGVAILEKPENEFTITEKMSTSDAYDLIMKAASEKRLGGGSLLAAGGWCAPSEILYGFLELESADGLLSIAELNAPRGGIQFTKGPQLGQLLLEANLGFVQTEAEAEAGEVKPVFDIECPDWDEVRLDAMGYAIRAGLLTDAAFPELLRRYLALGTIVHARRMNALTIQRISALIGATTTFAPVGAQPSFTADLLSAIELNAIRLREQYSMPLGATVEGVFPLWALAVVRSDLSRRTGVELLSVTDAQIQAWFSQRQISAQFVRDYQSINAGAANTVGGTANWTRYPDKVEFMLYPAGSFVRLGTDVIDLDTVYDTDDLTQNQFMAAFFEEGIAVANTGASGVKVTVGIPNLFGSTGYPSIGALANVAPTP